MHLSRNSPVHLVDRPDLLRRCLDELARSATLSFDLEFDNNRYRYGVTLCLIQVATPATCYVIDPLANLDLSPLHALFESPQIQKIVHAPGEDLRLLHSLGCYPKNVFDTEVVARLLNYEQTSLTVLLGEKLGFAMDKKQQKSNWLRRPLSPSQVQYAADDVIWLHPLKALLEKEAEGKGLTTFVQEEQDLLSTTIYTVQEKSSFLKPSDLYMLSPREQYITNGLFGYVHEVARNLDRPTYQVIRDELVRDLATGNRTPQSILDEPGVHPRLKNNRFVAGLAEQVERLRNEATALKLSPNKQRRPRTSPEEGAAFRTAALDLDEVFAPIQQGLADRFGAHAGKFLLSNRVVNELVKGTLSFRELKPAYRQALIRSLATSAGIDLRRYDEDGQGN